MLACSRITWKLHFKHYWALFLEFLILLSVGLILIICIFPKITQVMVMSRIESTL